MEEGKETTEGLEYLLFEHEMFHETFHWEWESIDLLRVTSKAFGEKGGQILDESSRKRKRKCSEKKDKA